MYKDKEKYLEYQRNYYQRNKYKKNKINKLSFEEECLKYNKIMLKRRQYYYNRRDKLNNKPIEKKEKILSLII